MKTLALLTVILIGLLGACSDTGTQERIAHAIAAANDSSSAASAAVDALTIAVEAANEATSRGGTLRGSESAEVAKTALLNASAALERSFELAAASVDALHAVDAGTAANTAAAEALNAANNAHSLTQSLVSIWIQIVEVHEAGQRSFEEALARGRRRDVPDPQAVLDALERRSAAVSARMRTFAEGFLEVVPAVGQRAQERAEATARYLSARFGEDAEH